jgi:hypothetical protein
MTSYEPITYETLPMWDAFKAARAALVEAHGEPVNLAPAGQSRHDPDQPLKHHGFSRMSVIWFIDVDGIPRNHGFHLDHERGASAYTWRVAAWVHGNGAVEIASTKPVPELIQTALNVVGFVVPVSHDG